MRIRTHIRRIRHAAQGFSLVEEVVAMGIVSMICFACLSSVTFARAQRFRDREAGIVTDFLTHYLEHLKALPFEQLDPGRPLNGLYDGSGNGPRLVIPPTGQWTDLQNNDYLVFHPDLAWLENRHPQFRLSLTSTSAGGQVESKHVKLELKWDQPLSNRVLTNRLDIVRVIDL